MKMNYDKSTFYDSYAPLTVDYIKEKLASATAKCAASSQIMDGQKIKIVLDDGGTLEYSFARDMLSLCENGGAVVSAPYTAVDLEGIALFSHLIPGEVRGYNVVYDTLTSLVTVFETWFGSYERAPREVWRHYSFGYVETGGDAPKARHALTNRIEGLGTHWKNDDGTEMLYFFPSVIWSSYVELSNPRGGITITGPSDYIKISDHQYIYTRGEQEYSGSFTLEVIDLFEFKHIGMRIGFTLEDELDYTVYTGSGEITGRHAQLEPLTDYGTEIPYDDATREMMANGPKGIRRSYRPAVLHDNHSKEAVDEIVRTKGRFFEGGTIMSSKNTMEPSDYLVGKTLVVRYDNGLAFEYSFVDGETLNWREYGASDWTKDNYRAYEPAKDLLVFAHICTGSQPLRNLTHAIDFRNALATCVDAWLGSSRNDWEASHNVYFGVMEIEGGPVPHAVSRHKFTTDLVGKAFSWTYGEYMQSIHVYSSPESYSWTIILPNNTGGVMWSSPCFYVKLRDDAYLMSWTEDLCNGNQGTFVLNTSIMHDAGFFFGIGGYAGGEPDVHLDPMGAFCRPLGGFDINKYFTR